MFTPPELHQSQASLAGPRLAPSRGLVWCSAAQAGAVAPALLLLTRCRSRGLRPVSFLSLGATTANL